MTQEKKQVFIIVFFGIMSFLTCLLFVEYRFFCAQAKELVALQEQYQMYIEEAYAIIEKNNQEDVMLDNQWYSPVFSRDNLDVTNMFVNREERYLKQSMIAHLKEQGFESLLNRITADEPILHRNDMVSKRMSEQPLPQVAAKTEKKLIKKPEKQMSRTSGLALMWPIERNRFWLSSFFGPRKNPDNSWGFHRGIDMAALKGTPVKAAVSGIVVEARYAPGYGNVVVLQHARKYKTRYAHLDTIGVKVGQKIIRGSVIGTVGDTGLVRKVGSDASHLHFEVCIFDKQVNPLQFFA